MARLGRPLVWASTLLAVAAAVAFAPVHPGEPARWQPEVVAAAHQVPQVQQVHRTQPARAAALPGRGAGAIAVRAALTRQGSPYVWAAAGPDAFDCSGLVVWSFEQAGVELPHSSQALARGGQPVAPDQIRPGDVITYYADASHVGLYVGGGKMVHASTYGVPVAVVPMDNAPIYNIRRY